MSIGTTTLGKLTVNRLIIGGNPFSGFSHQNPDRDAQMSHYYNAANIKQALREAERLGINSHVGRADRHVMRCLLEYWDEGGKIQWFAQTCPELGPIQRSVDNAIGNGAKACFVHGGVMDHLLAANQLDEVAPAIARLRKAGLAAGVAGHNPEVFLWAEKHLDVDFYMCSYYNPTRRDKNPEHVHGAQETFSDADRDAMVRVIPTLSRPVIHYKVLAAGRHQPKDALAFVAKHLRPQDAVCIGFFMKDNPRAIEEDLHLLEGFLQRGAGL